jgi:hypothetical protein
MKRILTTVLALLFVLVTQPFARASDDDSWSKPVNGLQARLSFVRTQSLNGTPLIRRTSNCAMCQMSRM